MRWWLEIGHLPQIILEIKEKNRCVLCGTDMSGDPALPYCDHVVMVNIVDNAIELISTQEMLGIIL
jgi:hypothetical protein